MKALLFDLDGTLLGMDWRVFISEYLKSLSAQFVDLMEPEVFSTRLMAATQVMVDSQDPSKTNEETFIDAFFAGLEVTPEELMPRFDAFYLNQFPKLARYTEAIPEARDVILAALDLGLMVVVATNPVFPKEAIFERMRWAKIEDLPFRLVTSYEFMHYCKPHQTYYREILDILGLAPNDCLMVGNDVEEDLPAGLLGMKTFLADRYLISRGELCYEPDGRGSLLDLKMQLPKLAAAR